MRLSPDMNARRLISIAKGGIDIGGIDERILIPGLTGVFEAMRDLYDAAVYQCAAHADDAPEQTQRWADEKLSKAIESVDRVMK